MAARMIRAKFDSSLNRHQACKCFMAIKRAKPADKTAVLDILEVFLARIEGRDIDAAVEPFLARIAAFGVKNLDMRSLRSMLNNPGGVGMKDSNLCVLLQATDREGIVPLLTFHGSRDWVNFRIYALLMKRDTKDQFQAFAIRYETDEGGRDQMAKGVHDFCHAQLCTSITARLKATTDDWIPESQPSFPLDACDEVGLVLCMLVSLYGGRSVAERLRHTKVRSHMMRLRALKPFVGDP